MVLQLYKILEQDFLDYKMYTLAGESASPANSRPEGAVPSA